MFETLRIDGEKKKTHNKTRSLAEKNAKPKTCRVETTKQGSDTRMHLWTVVGKSCLPRWQGKGKTKYKYILNIFLFVSQCKPHLVVKTEAAQPVAKSTIRSISWPTLIARIDSSHIDCGEINVLCLKSMASGVVHTYYLSLDCCGKILLYSAVVTVYCLL